MKGYQLKWRNHFGRMKKASLYNLRSVSDRRDDASWDKQNFDGETEMVRDGNDDDDDNENIADKAN
jgi:hypothetical protein